MVLACASSGRLTLCPGRERVCDYAHATWDYPRGGTPGVQRQRQRCGRRAGGGGGWTAPDHPQRRHGVSPRRHLGCVGLCDPGGRVWAQHPNANASIATGELRVH